jgi:hypothetical protein
MILTTPANESPITGHHIVNGLKTTKHSIISNKGSLNFEKMSVKQSKESYHNGKNRMN